MNLHIAYEIVKKYFKDDPSIYRKFMTHYRKYSKSPSDNLDSMDAAENIVLKAFKTHVNGKEAEKEYRGALNKGRLRAVSFERDYDNSRANRTWEDLCKDLPTYCSFYDNATRILNKQ